MREFAAAANDPILCKNRSKYSRADDEVTSAANHRWEEKIGRVQRALVIANALGKQTFKTFDHSESMFEIRDSGRPIRNGGG